MLCFNKNIDKFIITTKKDALMERLLIRKITIDYLSINITTTSFEGIVNSFFRSTDSFFQSSLAVY